MSREDRSRPFTVHSRFKSRETPGGSRSVGSLTSGPMGHDGQRQRLTRSSMLPSKILASGRFRDCYLIGLRDINHDSGIIRSSFKQTKITESL